MPALTTEERLAEARTALHELLTGQAAVEIRDSDGSSIRYTRADVSRLRAYIQELQDELAGATTAKRLPIKMGF